MWSSLKGMSMVDEGMQQVLRLLKITIGGNEMAVFLAGNSTLKNYIRILGVVIMMMTTNANAAPTFNLKSPQHYFNDPKTVALIAAAMTGDLPKAKWLVTANELEVAMEIRSDKIDELARAAFMERLDAAFRRDLQDYMEIDRNERYEFLALAMALAETKGFQTEQGIASYALALWYLGVDFEEKSTALESLLTSIYPEVRKVHAMNKWVEAVIGDPDNIAAADQAMKSALNVTGPWGTD